MKIVTELPIHWYSLFLSLSAQTPNQEELVPFTIYHPPLRVVDSEHH